MALVDTNVLWTKLESVDVSTITSETGGNFIVSGGTPTFEAAKFGNGITIDSNTENVNIPAASMTADFNLNEGMVECWLDLNYNVVNGDPSDGGNHEIFTLFDSSNVRQMFIAFQGGNNRMAVQFRWSGGGFITVAFQTGINITANTLTHFAFVWDVTHSTEKMRVYIGGVKVATANTSWTGASMSNAIFYLGTFRGTSENLNGNIDNLKWYNATTFETEMIANRETEGFGSAPVNPENVSATSGLFTDRIEVGWDAVTSATTYSLHRSLTSTSGFSVISAGQAGTSYTDTSVSPSITYYYLAYAENTVGTSTASSVDSGFLRNFSQYNFHSTILKTMTSANTILKTVTAHSTILMTMGVSSILN